MGSPLYKFDKEGSPILSGKCNLITPNKKNLYFYLSQSKLLNQIISGFNIATFNERNESIENYINFIVAMSRYNQKFIYLHIAPQPGWYIGTNFDDSFLITTLQNKGVNVVNGSLTDALGFYRVGTFIPYDNHPTFLANQIRASILLNHMKTLLN